MEKIKRDVQTELVKLSFAFKTLHMLAAHGDEDAKHAIEQISPIIKAVGERHPEAPKNWEDVPELAEIEFILRWYSTTVETKLSGERNVEKFLH